MKVPVSTLGKGMQICYIAPFRIDFDLNKDALLARWNRWAEVVQEAEKNIDQAPANAQLGNYAWGMVHRLQEGEEMAYGGTEEVEDPSWFFRRFFTLSFKGTCRYSSRPGGEGTLPDLLGAHPQNWECRLIDNTVGLLVLTAECPFDNFLEHLRGDTEGDLKKYLDQFGRLWATRLLVDIRDRIDHAGQWIDQHLIGPMGPEANDLDREFFSSFETPVYPLPKKSEDLRPLWTHQILAFSEGEKSRLIPEEEPFLQLFPAKEHAKAWLADGTNSYDWGCSVITLDPRYGNQWQDGNCISQFFYLCFDLADTALPVAIANQRIETANRKFTSVLESAQDIRQSMNLIATDYTDLLTRCSSEGYRSLEMYHRTWRMRDLLGGLHKKTELLEELINTASEGVARRNQERIQYILAFITILSVVGGMASMHDYLAEGYDPSSPEMLPRMALSISKVTVFATSLSIAILAFAAYFLFNRKRF